MHFQYSFKHKSPFHKESFQSDSGMGVNETDESANDDSIHLFLKMSYNQYLCHMQYLHQECFWLNFQNINILLHYTTRKFKTTLPGYHHNHQTNVWSENETRQTTVRAQLQIFQIFQDVSWFSVLQRTPATKCFCSVFGHRDFIVIIKYSIIININVQAYLRRFLTH